MENPQTGTGEIPPETELSPRSGKPPTGVRRVNNMPLVIIGGVLLVFVILVAMVAAQRGQHVQADSAAGSGPLPENSQVLDQMLANAALGGLVADPDENKLPSFALARVDDPDAPPVLGSDRAAAPQGAEDPVAVERMKMFQTAMRAKTGVASAAEPAAEEKRPVKTSGIKEDAETLQQAPERDDRIPVAAGGDYSKFDRQRGKKDKEDRWLLDSDVEQPRTAYEVRAGSVIPATMISGINSELPGQIVAQVSQDVFDTPTGRHRLVPQGSKLVGRYNHQVVMGQSRVLVAWQRIIFPDGKALDIGSMEGADGAGYAGFGDKVDRHYVRVFGSAILMSGIAAGLTSSRISPDNDPFGSSNAATLSQNLAQQIGEVATKMIEQNLNTAPTLKIRPGYRFNVMAVKDLTFDKPYQPFDY